MKELQVRASSCNITANYMTFCLIGYQHSCPHVQKGVGEEDRCGFKWDRFYGEHLVLLYGGVASHLLPMVPHGQAGETVSQVRVTVLSLNLLLSLGTPLSDTPGDPARPCSLCPSSWEAHSTPWHT